jgi:hypothetical protein
MTFELAVLIRHLAGSLALTAARILLLLTGLLTAALLLLAWLLTRVLVLLARFLGRIAHSGISLVVAVGVNGKSGRWLRGNNGSGGMIARQSRVGIVTRGTLRNRVPKNWLCTSSLSRSQRCCRPRFQTVRKPYDASDKAAGGPRRVAL